MNPRLFLIVSSLRKNIGEAVHGELTRSDNTLGNCSAIAPELLYHLRPCRRSALPYYTPSLRLIVSLERRV